MGEAGGTRHYELAQHLAERGHRVTIIASQVSYLTGKAESAPAEEHAGPANRVKILRAYTYKALHRSFIHRVISFFSFMFSSFLLGLRVQQVDLVWGTSPPIFQGVTAWALARLKRVPFLFEVRDLWPAFAIDVGVLRNPILIRASLWLEAFLYHRADRLMVNSPGFIEHVTRRGAQQVALIPNGADAAMFDPYASGAGFREDFDLQGKFVAVYAGAHGMSNDLGVLLQAAQELADAQQVIIALLGDGKEKPALIKMAEDMKLKNVRFIPPLPKVRMAQALAAADACIAILKPIPMYATVYPNKVFDYLAAGRPVILAIDGVIRQVVEAAGAGVFVPPGDAHALALALRQLASQPDLGRAMGLRGRQYVEAHFNRPDLAEKLVGLVEEMVRQKS